MPQTVTVTRTTTASSNNSYIVISTGICKTWSGILKLLQCILGLICVVILAYDWNNTIFYSNELFFLNIVVCFMIGTLILLISCLLSLNTEGLISKTIFVSFIKFTSIILLSIFVAGSYISHYCWNTSVDSVISFHIEPKPSLFKRFSLGRWNNWTYQCWVVYFKCFPGE